MAWIYFALPRLALLTASFFQTVIYTQSLTGTSYTSPLPPFLTDNPLHSEYPWGAVTGATTNPPNTGVIRSYEFTISRGFNSADGFNKSVILINNRFPGPLIEANWGDIIQVNVTNNIKSPEEGTSIHWHGLPQKLSPWYDGVPSVSQCPIAPGSTFTYAFRAESYGTSWYHSHVSAQYIDGVFGPLVIYGPTEAAYDIDLGPVLLAEYYHTPYFQLIGDIYDKPPIFLLSDNNLINGRNDFNCGSISNSSMCQQVTGFSRFRFETGKTHRLRLINAGGTATQKFSIDNHEMMVIANDFVPIRPYTTSVVTLGVGQRSDVLVKANGESTDAVWMRSDLDQDCFPAVASQPHALAAIYYPDASPALPGTTATPWISNNCSNDPLSATIPFFPIEPPKQPAVTQTIDIVGKLNDTGYLLFFVDNSSFRANYNNPLLLLANMGNVSYPNDPQWNVYNFGKHTSIRVVLRNYFPLVHPMHLHGHNFWVLAEGTGEWDGTITNPSNPQRRDTQLMVSGTPDVPSYVVLEWNADNPGVWPLHCHVVVHVSAGLYINVMERPDLITERQIPSVMAQTCRDWAQYSERNVVDQIDSGL